MAVQDVVVVNGTTLYYAMQGTGPSVLCIAGTTGHAGHFAQVATQLADEFIIVTYDRRGPAWHGRLHRISALLGVLRLTTARRIDGGIR